MRLYCSLPDQTAWFLLNSIVADDVDLISITNPTEIPVDATVLLLEKGTDLAEFRRNCEEKHALLYGWEMLLENLRVAMWGVYYNEEKYYLNYALRKACRPETSTIILGSSYAKYGVLPSELGEDCINLGLDAQDPYYACKLASICLDKNPNLRNIVFAHNYYWLFTDISKANTPFSMHILSSTYYPVLHDLHHADAFVLNQFHSEMQLPPFLDLEKCKRVFTLFFFHRNRQQSARMQRMYCVDDHQNWRIEQWYSMPDDSREISGQLYDWSMLPEHIKDQFAAVRTKNHNKLQKHHVSYVENQNILQNFILQCNRKNVQVYLICMPQTKHYFRYLNPDYRLFYEEALDKISAEFHCLDFNEGNIFQSNDFMDYEHLNVQGAEKLTVFLKEILSGG